MKKENTGFLILCICYLLYFITMGVYTPYLNLYYERIGLSGSQIGMINSFGYIAAMLLSPLWGAITDKTHKYKAMVSTLVMATALTGIIWQKQSIFFWILMTSLFLNIFRSNIVNILDALCIQYCKENNREFSLIRSMGSLGYLLGSFLIGNLMFELFNIQGPYIQVMLVIAVIFEILMLFVKEPAFETQTHDNHNFKSNIKELMHNRDYIFILILTFFTAMIMDSANFYIANHLISTMGLKDSVIGLSTCAMVLPEVFIIMRYHRFMRQWGLKNVFTVAIMTQILRFAIYAFTSNVYIFMLASTMHGIMVGAGTVGVVTYIHKKIPSYMLATAMTMYGGFTVIGYAFQSQLLGTVYQLFGSHMIFIVTLTFTGIALLLTIKSKRFD